MAHTNTTGAAAQHPSDTSTQSGGSIGASLIPAKSMAAGYQGLAPLATD
jgi:hypothetical protein